MTKLDALKELLAKVEAGGIEGYAFEFADISGAYAQHAVQAYHGSLDAAKALHEAVLPEWNWGVTACHEDRPAAFVELREGYGFEAENPIPSRALLICDLKALIAMETDQ